MTLTVLVPPVSVTDEPVQVTLDEPLASITPLVPDQAQLYEVAAGVPDTAVLVYV